MLYNFFHNIYEGLDLYSVNITIYCTNWSRLKLDFTHKRCILSNICIYLFFILKFIYNTIEERNVQILFCKNLYTNKNPPLLTMYSFSCMFVNEVPQCINRLVAGTFPIGPASKITVIHMIYSSPGTCGLKNFQEERTCKLPRTPK